MRTLRVFVAGSDLEEHEEPAHVQHAIELINDGLLANGHAKLERWWWPSDAENDVSADGPQGVINPELYRADLVIVVVRHRIGRGTMVEARYALGEALRRQDSGPLSVAHGIHQPSSVASDQPPRLPVMVYFANHWMSFPISRRARRVRAFRESIANQSLYRTYESLDQFQNLVTQNLQAAVKRLIGRPSVAEPALSALIVKVIGLTEIGALAEDFTSRAFDETLHIESLERVRNSIDDLRIGLQKVRVEVQVGSEAAGNLVNEIREDTAWLTVDMTRTLRRPADLPARREQWEQRRQSILAARARLQQLAGLNPLPPPLAHAG